MDTEGRRRWILKRARSVGGIKVTALSQDLNVAQETIRRDLRALEEQGMVRRTHGGAHAVERPGFETTLASRSTNFVPQKNRIAAVAADLLGEAETVFIDEGYTPQLIAAALPRDRTLTVVTASLSVPRALADAEKITVLMLGGRVRNATLATVDHWASRMLAGMVIDLAYIGANGISREFGLTTPDPAVSEVKAQAVRGSRRRVFAGLHTKFGVATFCRFADVRDVESIVTDTGLSAAEAQRYSLLGPNVIRV
ncbi:DeoR/GlpR family DNA-binding transcription regulator [Streptomyces sp. NPDC048527]|uniref:DeoR/GlpR family DNA-binding transcription regulator n=1 Tax=Streptomyces sp. NPDC048527 TaxID=3365568 RepID=UPI0037166C89